MSNSFITALFRDYVEHTIAPKFVELLKEEIEKEQFEWDTITVRKNGQIVKSPRNVVDTGELRDSLDIEVEITDENTVTMFAVYTAEHAVNVYYGYVDDNGQLKLGRDWITPAIDQLVKGNEQ